MTTTNHQPSHPIPNPTIESNLNSTPIIIPSSAALIELILSKSDSIDLIYLDTLKKTHLEVLCCLPSDSEEGDSDQDVLESVLDAGIHGFGYFVILSVRIGYGKFGTVQKVLKHIKMFCRSVRKLHLQNLSIDLKGFVKSLIEFGRRYEVLYELVEPIFSLICTLDEAEVLTSLHSQLMKVALFTRDYKRAIELSNLDLIKINRKDHPIDYQDHLLYHYFAGIIQALNRNYKRSIQLLTIAVSAPGSSISQIQIEAYKKLILINLLYNPSSIHHHNLPKYTNSQFKSLFSKVGKVYLDLVGYFYNSINSLGTIEDEKLYGFVQKNVNCFLQDRNYGLVKLCIEVLPRRKITNLIPIYKSIPIPTISKILNEPNQPKLISLIRSMINTQEIHAEIDEPKQRLDFLNPIEPIIDFRQMIGRIKGLENQMKEIEAGIERNPEYLKKTLKELKEMEKPMGGISGVGPGGLDAHHGLVQQQFLQQQQQQQSHLGSVGEEDLGVGEENGWDEQDSFK